MGTHKHRQRMITLDEQELGRLKEKDLANIYEGLCGAKFPNVKPRDQMAEWFGFKSSKTYDKVKQGNAHAPAHGWIVASKRLETSLWFDWVEVQKKQIQ